MPEYSKPYDPPEKVWAIMCYSSWTDGYNDHPGAKVIEIHKTLEAAGKRLAILDTEYNKIKTAHDVYAHFFIEEVDLYD